METGAFEQFFGELEDPIYLLIFYFWWYVRPSLEPKDGKISKILAICILTGLPLRDYSRTAYRFMTP